MNLNSNMVEGTKVFVCENATTYRAIPNDFNPIPDKWFGNKLSSILFTITHKIREGGRLFYILRSDNFGDIKVDAGYVVNGNVKIKYITVDNPNANRITDCSMNTGIYNNQPNIQKVAALPDKQLEDVDTAGVIMPIAVKRSISMRFRDFDKIDLGIKVNYEPINIKFKDDKN